MVRKATFWVTGIRERNAAWSPGGRTTGSGGGGGPNTGMSESFHPIGSGIFGPGRVVPAVGAFAVPDMPEMSPEALGSAADSEPSGDGDCDPAAEGSPDGSNAESEGHVVGDAAVPDKTDMGCAGVASDGAAAGRDRSVAQPATGSTTRPVQIAASTIWRRDSLITPAPYGPRATLPFRGASDGARRTTWACT